MKIIPFASAKSAINSVAKEVEGRVSILGYEERTDPLPGRRRAHNGHTNYLKQSVGICQEDPLLAGLLAARAGTGEQELPDLAKSNGATLLIYCSKGRGWCEIEGKRYEILAGTLLILQSGIRASHGTYPECPWRIAWVEARGSNIDYFLRELGTTKEQPLLEVGEDPQLLSLFYEILEALAEPCSRPRLIYAAQTLGHLFGVLIWHTKNAQHVKPDLNRRVELSIEYMQQHLGKPLHVATLAGLINVSSSYYAVLFKRQTGYSPIDYFIRLRMKQACRLLESTSLHIKEIAASLGYDDQFYFSRIFRAVVRKAPSEYRQGRRKEDVGTNLVESTTRGASCIVSKC
jgi:AraC-like DNA-binding protein